MYPGIFGARSVLRISVRVILHSFTSTHASFAKRNQFSASCAYFFLCVSFSLVFACSFARSVANSYAVLEPMEMRMADSVFV